MRHGIEERRDRRKTNGKWKGTIRRELLERGTEVTRKQTRKGEILGGRKSEAETGEWGNESARHKEKKKETKWQRKAEAVQLKQDIQGNIRQRNKREKINIPSSVRLFLFVYKMIEKAWKYCFLFGDAETAMTTSATRALTTCAENTCYWS